MTKADAYFAMVPEWLIPLVKPRSLQVYCLLRRHADYNTDETFIGVKTLAALATVSEDTIRASIRELIASGALTSEVRFDAGRQTTNLYTVHTIRLNSAPRVFPGDGGGKNSGDGGGKNSGPYNESQSAESQSTDLAVPGSKEEHDSMVFALMHAMGWRYEEVTQPQWGRLHKAAKCLTDIGADPADVPHRARVYEVNFRGATMTPNAIAVNWSDLASARSPVSDRDVRRASTRAATRDAITARMADDEHRHTGPDVDG